MKKIPEISFNSDKSFLINGFHLLAINELMSDTTKHKDHSPYEPHRLGFFTLLIITRGEVQHSVDFETHTLRQGDVMVLSKGQIHAFDENSEYNGYLVVFTDAFMQKYMAQSTITQINHLYNYFLHQEKIANPDFSNFFLRELKDVLQGASSSAPNIIGSLLSIYLLKLNDANTRTNGNFTDDKNVEYFNQFKALVERKFATTRDAKFYATELSISYKHLNEVCKYVVKDTAKSFIDRYVILEAKRRLVSTSLSAKEIAFSLGFNEATNFLKYFKKHTHLTPLEFRTSLV